MTKQLDKHNLAYFEFYLKSFYKKEKIELEYNLVKTQEENKNDKEPQNCVISREEFNNFEDIALERVDEIDNNPISPNISEDNYNQNIKNSRNDNIIESINNTNDILKADIDIPLSLADYESKIKENINYIIKEDQPESCKEKENNIIIPDTQLEHSKEKIYEQDCYVSLESETLDRIYKEKTEDIIYTNIDDLIGTNNQYKKKNSLKELSILIDATIDNKKETQSKDKDKDKDKSTPTSKVNIDELISTRLKETGIISKDKDITSSVTSLSNTTQIKTRKGIKANETTKNEVKNNIVNDLLQNKRKRSKDLIETPNNIEKEVTKAKINKQNESNKKSEKVERKISEDDKFKIKDKNIFTKIALEQYDGLDSKLKKDLKSIKCELVDHDDLDYDVLLCNKLTKNFKILYTINSRKPILSTKWLQDSITNKKTMAYDKYYLKDKEFEKKFNFSLSDILSSTPFAEYMEEYSFYVTENVNPQKIEIEDLIESANGEVIQNYKNKKNKNNLIIIADKNADRDLIKNLKTKNYKIYNIDLILDSVLSQELDLNKNKYKI